MRVTLIQAGEFETQEFPIDVDEFVIGRDHACHLRIDHGRISRNHCRIHRVDDKVLVEALYSAAGTAVNHTVVDPNRPPVEVHDGDHLWVGAEHFQFLIESNAYGRDQTAADLGSSANVEPMANPLLKFEPSNPLVKSTTTSTASHYRMTHPQRPHTVPPTDPAREPVPLEPAEEEEPEELGTAIVTQMDGVAVVRLLQKTIVSVSDVRAITEKLSELINAGQNRITLHLGSVERLTSEVLGEVYQISRRCKAEGGMLKICKVSPHVADVFALTNMQKHIEIFPDEIAARRSDWPQAAPEKAAKAKAARAPRPGPARSPPLPLPLPCPTIMCN